MEINGCTSTPPQHAFTEDSLQCVQCGVSRVTTTCLCGKSVSKDTQKKVDELWLPRTDGSPPIPYREFNEKTYPLSSTDVVENKILDILQFPSKYANNKGILSGNLDAILKLFAEERTRVIREQHDANGN